MSKFKSKIKEFDRAVVDGLVEEVKDALEPIAKKYGIKFQSGGARFGKDTLNYKCKFGVVTSGGLDKGEFNVFRRIAPSWGLSPDLFGKEFSVNGVTYKIVGCSTRSRKYPITVERADGKRFKMSPEFLRLSINLY